MSGISTEIFRQIETVENDHHDATTAAALEAVERRGEMLVRVLDPRQMGRNASEAARSFLTVQVSAILFPSKFFHHQFNDSFHLQSIVLVCHSAFLVTSNWSLYFA